MKVFEAYKQHFLNVMKGAEVETLAEFDQRGLLFKQEMLEYARENVSEDESLLIVTHSRMINVINETMKWDEELKRYTWGTHCNVADIFHCEF